MMIRSIFILFICLVLCDGAFYDYYNGTRVSASMLAYYNSTGRLSTCTIFVKPCNAIERRRVDGTCNNLDNPAQGTFNVPHPRLLPASYFNGKYPRRSVSGKELMLPRQVRVKLLCEGISVNTKLTQAVPAFAIFAFADVGSLHDIRYYLINKTDCCTTGKNDYMCTPNIIPKDDPVHRFSGIRCMNMTRPLDFQYFGCTNDSIPSPIEQATAVYDLSNIYNGNNRGDKLIRSFKCGQILTEVENGIIWPPNGTGYCPANNPGQKCFKNFSNSLLQVQLFTIWFIRLHNYFAKQLAMINPCWNDDELFFNAREINIAFYQQIHVYEWLSNLVGKKNLIDSGVASSCSGFRDIYDNTTYLSTTLEFTHVNRWFHVLQHGSAKMYDTDGTFLKDYPIVNSTFRTGYLAEGKNIFYLTQGKFRQPTGGTHGVDPDMAEMGLPYIQRALDVPTSDLHKNRLFGLRPYIDYVQFCSGYNITCFDDLRLVMEKDKILIMKDIYEDVRDIDLMAGLWSERLLKGGEIPQTFACLLKDSILKTIKADRHWYERSNRPYAFTKAQLQEIRKASLALLLCTVGDGVTQVQRHAFLNIGHRNPLVSCDKIPKIDFSHWAANCTV